MTPICAVFEAQILKLLRIDRKTERSLKVKFCRAQYRCLNSRSRVTRSSLCVCPSVRAHSTAAEQSFCQLSDGCLVSYDSISCTRPDSNPNPLHSGQGDCPAAVKFAPTDIRTHRLPRITRLLLENAPQLSKGVVIQRLLNLCRQTDGRTDSLE